MLIKCAWCGRTVGNKPPFGGKFDKEVVEGICDACLNEHFPHHADKIRGCLEVKRIEHIYQGSIPFEKPLRGVEIDSGAS